MHQSVGQTVIDTLPGGATLAPGETVLVRGRFMVSTPAYFLHTELALTDRRLHSVRPNTLLGIIPVGTRRESFPMESIAGIGAATRFDVAAVVVGAIGILFAVAALSIPAVAWLGVILLAWGVVVFLSAPKQALELTNSGGDKIAFKVSVLERGKTSAFANSVSAALAGLPSRVAPSASYGPTAAPSSVSEDPRDALRGLQTLRDEGLISDDEYTAKRNEILARI